MGVAERDDDALREVSLSFGGVSSIERNAKVTAEREGGAVHETVSIDHIYFCTSLNENILLERLLSYIFGASIDRGSRADHTTIMIMDSNMIPLL